MAIFQVTNNNNSGINSLRWALNRANNTEGQDTIILNSDVNLDGNNIAITDSVEIVGNGHTISQAADDRIFTIDDGNADFDAQVDLKDLKLTGGSPDQTGGAILSYENLSVVNSEFYDNATTLRGGAIYLEGAELTVKNSYFHNNTIASGSTSAGGAIYVREGLVQIDDSTFESNSALGSGGIALVTNTVAEINNSQFIDNQGGGIGVLFNSTLKLNDSTLSQNQSSFSGGGIIVETDSSAVITNSDINNNVAPHGAGIEVIDSEVKIIESTITGNAANGDGGGVDVYDGSKLTVINSTISGNSAFFGGGIASSSNDSQVRVVNSEVEGNSIFDTQGDEFNFLTVDDINIDGAAIEDILEGKVGNDSLYGNDGNDLVIGKAGDDTLFGNAGEDTLFGGQGKDVLDGGNDSDMLNGGTQNDTLLGGGGNDTLLGGAGNDILDGGTGENILTGGQGADQFNIHEDGYARIRDFELGTDSIGLSEGLTFDDLTIVGDNKADIFANGTRIATLLDINSSNLTSADFETL